MQFSEAVEAAGLNLYGTEGDAIGPADLTLVGVSSGSINGSIQVSDRNLLFVSTSGDLRPDTYTVKLVSGVRSIKGSTGDSLLDGEFDGNFPPETVVRAETL